MVFTPTQGKELHNGVTRARKGHLRVYLPHSVCSNTTVHTLSTMVDTVTVVMMTIRTW